MPRRSSSGTCPGRSVVSGSLKPFQCQGCAKDEAEALADRKLREAAERARARHERAAREATLAATALTARRVPVALKKGNGVFAGPDRVGKALTCFVCKGRVRGERLANGTFGFLHDPGQSCDARRAWVRAGMWEVYKHLQAKPERICLSRPCSGRGCTAWLRGHLPSFDRLEAEEPSIVLYKDDEPVMQLVLGREPKLIGAPLVVELRPGKVVHCPTRLVGAKDGSLCSTCEERRVRLETAARDIRKAQERDLKAREEAEVEILRRRREQTSAYKHSGAFASYHTELLRRKVAKLNQEPERVQQAVTYAKRYFGEQGIALGYAQTHGAVVRRCEHCRAPVALLHLSNLFDIPAGLEQMLARTSPQGGELRNRCGNCKGLLGNARDMLGPGAVYLLPEFFWSS